MESELRRLWSVSRQIRRRGLRLQYRRVSLQLRDLRQGLRNRHAFLTSVADKGDDGITRILGEERLQAIVSQVLQHKLHIRHFALR